MARPHSDSPRDIVFKFRMTLEEYQELYSFSDKMKQSKSKTIRKALEKYYSENQSKIFDDSQPMLPGIE